MSRQMLVLALLGLVAVAAYASAQERASAEPAAEVQKRRNYDYERYEHHEHEHRRHKSYYDKDDEHEDDEHEDDKHEDDEGDKYENETHSDTDGDKEKEKESEYKDKESEHKSKPKHSKAKKYQFELALVIKNFAGGAATPKTGDSLVRVIEMFDGKQLVGEVYATGTVTYVDNGTVGANFILNIQFTNGTYEDSRLSATAHVVWDTTGKILDEFDVIAGHGDFLGAIGTVATSGKNFTPDKIEFDLLVPGIKADDHKEGYAF